MRRKITLLMIIALTTMGAIAHSGSGASKLNLLLFDDGNFTVVLDGVRYPNVNGNFRVPNLYAGTHRIRIVENFIGHRGHRTGKEILYSGPVNIPYNSKVTVRLTPHNRLRTIKVVRNPHARHVNRRNTNPRSRYNRGYNPRSGHSHAKNNRQFQFIEAKRSIKHARFEKDKLSLARETARTQILSAHQVAELMDLMSFEQTRLKFAKFAFRQSGRNQNYLHIVSRSLDFSSSKRELARFIRNN
jgi:hypothetical protein